ncbi:nuclear transport factor 2 family protein [Rhodanobacter sp. Col0626]|uniref:nuclear transport factor 2 family protein n=1 Tax=Rhodanobacter sp. Col0626 TaxID=3415679 RepID=UPI003CF846E5
MRMSRLGSLAGFAVFGLCRVAHGTETPEVLRGELLQITQTLVDAIPQGNRQPWNQLLTKDAVIIDEFGRIAHKADTVASLRPFPAGLSGSIELRDAHVRRYGDAALMQVEQYERETVFGQKLVVRYQTLLTFVRQSGKWKLAGYEDVTIPTAPPELRVEGLVPGDYVGTYRYAPKSAWTISAHDGVLAYTSHAGGPANVLHPIAKDVFVGSDDERNLLIFRRDQKGHIVALIERRKFNDLRLNRDS